MVNADTAHNEGSNADAQAATLEYGSVSQR